MVICLERGVNDLHMVQLMPLPPQSSFAPVKSRMVYFLVPAYPGCPTRRPASADRTARAANFRRDLEAT